MKYSFQSSRQLNEQQKDFLLTSLNSICDELDLTQSQLERIKTAYESVGKLLASSDQELLKGAHIYVQGSVRLRTAVKPLGKDEFDVDLICHLPHANNCSRDEMLAAVKACLDGNDIYKKLVLPLARGFRINYAGNYHLDITPARDHELKNALKGHAVWVPDKRDQWKESNAIGMAEWFETICKLTPKRQAKGMLTEARYKGTVEKLPDQDFKTPLNRIVQILKRHRDEWAEMKGNEFSEYKPISVLITTLTSHAYKKISESSHIYRNDFDILLDVIEIMPQYITTDYITGEIIVNNPSMQHENYAEKWNRLENNEGNKLQQAFNLWHKNAINTFDELATQQNQGLDKFFNSLEKYFGKTPVTAARNKLLNEVDKARSSGNLFSQMGTGLLSTGIALNAMPTIATPANTFFGGDDLSAPSVPIKNNTFFGK